MEYAQIQAFFAVLLALGGSITVIGGVVALVVRFWKWAHKDTEKNAEDIGEFRKWLASDKHRIEDLEGDFDEIIEQNNLLMRAVVAIMDHQLDGNHTDRLEEARDEVDKYLIDTKTVKRRRKEKI